MVTNDKYELPLGVYDSLDDMARKQQVKKEYIKKSISMYEHNKATWAVPFRRVVVEDEA
jgi:hypothetical protein